MQLPRQAIAPPHLIASLCIIYFGLLATRFELNGIAQAAYAIGGAMTIALMCVLTAKLILNSPQPVPASTSYGLLAAPPALLFLIEASPAGTKIPVVATVLICIGICYLVLLLPSFVKIWRNAYATSFWSFGMPFAAMILAIHEYAVLNQSGAMLLVSEVLTGLLAGVVMRCLFGMAAAAGK